MFAPGVFGLRGALKPWGSKPWIAEMIDEIGELAAAVVEVVARVAVVAALAWAANPAGS